MRVCIRVYVILVYHLHDCFRIKFKYQNLSIDIIYSLFAPYRYDYFLEQNINSDLI